MTSKSACKIGKIANCAKLSSISITISTKTCEELKRANSREVFAKGQKVLRCMTKFVALRFKNLFASSR